MLTATVFFNDPTEPVDDGDVRAKCKEQFDFTPAAIREVNSGMSDSRAYMCFESETDAQLWDAQK